MTTYATENEAIDQYIRPALGESAYKYDIHAIFDDCFLRQDDGFLLVIEDFQFAGIAASHDLTTWHKVGTSGEWQDPDGNALTYGDFGRDTYALWTTVDGIERRMCIRAYDLRQPVEAEADELLAMLAAGWRAINW